MKLSDLLWALVGYFVLGPILVGIGWLLFWYWLLFIP